MTSDFFEEIVATWLQVNNYFIINNVKYGRNNEIDILAIKNKFNKVTHVEVSCSSNPITILGTNNVKDNKNYKECAEIYINKKYFNKDVSDKIQGIVGRAIPIERWLVYAKLKEPKQLNIFESKGIKTFNVNEILQNIKNTNLNAFSGDKRIKQLLDIMADAKFD